MIPSLSITILIWRLAFKFNYAAGARFVSPLKRVCFNFVGKVDAVFMCLLLHFDSIRFCHLRVLRGLRSETPSSPSRRVLKGGERKKESALRAGSHLSSRRRWRHAAGRLVLCVLLFHRGRVKQVATTLASFPLAHNKLYSFVTYHFSIYLFSYVFIGS